MTTPAESDHAQAGNCARCRDPFPRDELRHASIPSLVALSIATDHEPWDAEPPPIILDRELYCPECRRRVNLRRALGAFLFAAIMAVMTALAFRIREGRIFG
jgi:hypothetical protein